MKKNLFSRLFATAALLLVTASLKAQPMAYRVDTINDLVAITTQGSDAKVLAYVGGGTARDDGLGGLFFFDGLSTAATNVYAIYRPNSIAAAAAGRWFKLPTAVANQQTDVTVATDTTYAWKLLDGNAVNAFSIGLTSANVYMQTWGSRPLYINSSLGGNDTILNVTGGNVGIGTTSPQATLEIENGANIQMRLGNGDSNALFTYDIGRSTANGLLNFYGNQTGANGYIFSGIDGERMRITPAGNVGIGTTAPGALLDVRGAAIFNEDGADVDFRIESDSNANHFKVDAGLFSGAGAVGIGRAPSGAYLHVEHPAITLLANANFQNFQSGANGSLTTAASGTHARITSAYFAEPSITIGTAPVTLAATVMIDGAPTEATTNAALYVASGVSYFGGNVGIGTATPLAKLAVNGGVHVGGISDPGDNNLTVDGTSTLTGTVAIGGGAAIAKILSATAVLDFGNTLTLTSTDLTITVTGATVGSSVAIGLPAAPDANACFTAWVSAVDTVTVRFNNYSSGAIDPASDTYRATVTTF